MPWTLWQSQDVQNGGLVIFQYDLGGCIDSEHRATVKQLLGRGLSVATVDWPLHGQRHSPKLSARLLDATKVSEGDPNGAGLVRYLVEQSALDLRRGLDWTTHQTQIRTERIALLGCGWAAPLMGLLAAVDQRAAVLALYGEPTPPAGRLPDLLEVVAASSIDSMLWLTSDLADPDSSAWAEALRRNCPGEFQAEVQAGGRVDSLEDASAHRVHRFIADALG
ncbi:MAG: hypothetical protein P8M78_11970 [Myxococcota bacterium]|nr:hypothetical protein [Myxococcota bacterium]